MKKTFHTFVRRAGTACAALGLSLSAAFAGEPGDFPAEYGYALTGLGTGGDEVALVFTNTAYTAESPMEWTLPDGAKSIWYLVVGGGGSGGAEYGNYFAGGGGGGAGGMVENKECLITSPDLSVVVGNGGASVTGARNGVDGKTGGNSTLTVNGTAVIAHGGGGGGAARNSSTKGAGLKGGSGGGGGRTEYGEGGACYEGEGNIGGTGKGLDSNNQRGGGGGGGAGGEGQSTTASKGGKGGDGAISNIGGGSVSKYKDDDGNEYYCAGGGGGYASTSTKVLPGEGGLGGGGKGGGDTGVSATNYGCGGGGTKGNGSTTTRKSGAGYQGVVVVRYRVLAANEALVPTIASKSYNGETQTADVTDGEGYYVKENLGGVDAGDYVVTLALSNGWHWTGGSTSDTNLTFKITKIDNGWTTEPSLSKTAWTLEESPAEVNAGEAVNGEVVVTYDAGATEMPLTVGSHSAIFTVAESKNYNELQKTIGYTVNKNANPWTTTPSITPTAWELDQDPGVVTNGVAKFGGTATVTYDGIEQEMPMTLGQHTAVFTVAEGDTYVGVSKTIKYTVNKNTNAWTTEPVLSKTTWVFDQDPAEVTMGIAKYGDCELTWDGDPEIATMPTGIGDHTASFVVTGTVTYTALAKDIAYSVTKYVNKWETEPVVPTSYNIEDSVPAFVDPTATHGDAYRYFDGDTTITEPPTTLGSHTVTYKVDEGDEYQGYEQTYAFTVTYKAITDWKDASKVYGYRIPKLGDGQNEVALVFTNTAYTSENPMNYRLPYGVTEVSYLVVGGGASGGATYNANSAGGGGAGGVLTNETGYAVEPGAALQVVVGAGGATSSGYGKDGKPSTLTINEAEFVALKGGAGGCGSTTHNGAGGTGYACGGGAGSSAGAGSGDGGYGTQGGNGADRPGGYWMGGGAGGAGGSAEKESRIGGAGVEVSIFGEALTIAKGGDGSLNLGTKPSSGAIWGCGGDGKCGNNGYSSGAGYQGVVVVRYAEDPLAVTVPYIAPKEYTGNPQVADVPASDKYSVTANEGGTDVGGYGVTLTLTPDQGYYWDCEVPYMADPTNLVFEITQAQNVWTVEPSISKDYWLTTDEPGVLTNGVTRFGEVTRVIVKDGGAAEPFTELPTAAGVYVITNIAPEATENYLAPDVTEKTVAFTIFGASETPDFTVAFNGAVAVGEAEGVVTAAVPYRVSCEVASTKLVDVIALVALEGADETNEVEMANGVALDAAGFGLLEDLVPGTNYWVSLYGKGVEDKKLSPTTDVVCVTATGPATGLTASATFTNDPKEFVITGSVTPGLGTTTVYLRWSLNSEDLGQLATYTFAYGESGAFATNIAYEAFSDWLYWDVAVSNNYASGTYGELAWSDAKAAKTVTRKDAQATAYTWNGNGGDNRWANDKNWTPSTSPCYGIPDGSKATANVWAQRTLDLGGQTFAVAAFGMSANQTVTLTNGTLNLPVKQIKTNCHLCLKDGGAIKTSTEDCIFAQNGINGVLELAGDATVNGDVNTYCYNPDTAPIGNIVRVSGANNKITGDLINQNGRLLVDVRDGSLEVRGLNVWAGGAYPLELAVSNATVSAKSFGSNHAGSQTTNRRQFDVFIPANGLADAPITVATAYDLTAAAYFELTCDEAFVGGKVPLIKGIKSIPAAATLVANTTYPDKFTSVKYTLEDGVLYVQLKRSGFIFFVK